MKKLWLLGLAGLLLFAGCAGTTAVTTGSSATTTSIASTPAVTAPGEPVAVNYVRGPYEPVVPGGPTIEIALKNVSDRPIASLSAVLGIGGAPPGHPYTFNFNIASQAPLLPGLSVVKRMTLIGSGFGSDTDYPLIISGAFEGGETFSFTASVKITSPPG
jgi:ABC-type Fe3+-hydroxamate transport system substrate-binding protein